MDEQKMADNGWDEHKKAVLGEIEHLREDHRLLRSEVRDGFERLHHRIDKLPAPGTSEICRIDRQKVNSLEAFQRRAGWTGLGTAIAIILGLIALLIQGSP